MLAATLEEIAEYFKSLQNTDKKAIGKRVIRYGCDEEMFMKWNETLQTRCRDLLLDFEDILFDGNQDLQDFNDDLEPFTRQSKDHYFLSRRQCRVRPRSRKNAPTTKGQSNSIQDPASSKGRKIV